ncbi:MAG: hypothetical protein KKA79_02870 [Nanoarchaeota archaeon]|nr:hypothetical protein [Nanoarchaeota archaeon]
MVKHSNPLSRVRLEFKKRDRKSMIWNVIFFIVGIVGGIAIDKFLPW